MKNCIRRIWGVILAAILSVSLLAAPVFAIPTADEPTAEPGVTTPTTPETPTNPTNPDDPDNPDNPTEPENPEQDNPTCYDEVGGIGWLICPGTSFLANIIDGAYEILEKLITVDPLPEDENSPIRLVWEYMRNLANICFIIAFIVIAYSQLTGLGINNYGIKRMLPRLIIAAILVNLSYIICEVCIEVSNILGYSLRSFFSNIAEMAVTNGTVAEGVTSIGVGDIVSTILGVGVAAGGAVVGLAVVGGWTGLLWFLIPVVLSGALAIISALVTMAARQALIILLVMISPLAFVAYLLPNTEGWFDKWKKLFTSMLIFFPTFSILYGASNLAGLVIITSAKDWLGVILGIAVMVIPLAMSIPLLRMSGTVLGRIDGMIQRAGSRPLGAVRRASDEHRALARENMLRSNSYRPHARLAQYMHKRTTRRQTDLANKTAANRDVYTAEAYTSMKNRRGIYGRRGMDYYDDQQRRMNAKAAQVDFDLDMDKGLDDTMIRRSDHNRLRAVNAGYSKAILDNHINTSRARVVNMDNLKQRAETIQEGLKSTDESINRRIASAFNYRHLSADQIAGLSAADRLAYEQTAERATNAVLADAIAAKRQADSDAEKTYLELYNDMPAGPYIQQHLERAFETGDYSSLAAAMQVMSKRGDYSDISDSMLKMSKKITGEQYLRIQKTLADNLLSMKHDDALLWGWGKSLMIRRGMHEAGKQIDGYIDLESYLRDGRADADVDQSAWDKVKRTAIMKGITDPGIAKTQDRTMWKSILNAQVDHIIDNPNDLLFEMKQIRSAASSGTIDGETLDAINALLTGCHSKIAAGTASDEERTYFETNKNAIERNVMSYVDEMSGGQLATSKSATIKSINDMLMTLDTEQGRDIIDLGDGMRVSKKLYDAFANQRSALNKDSATSQRASINPWIRKLLGIRLD